MRNKEKWSNKTSVGPEGYDETDMESDKGITWTEKWWKREGKGEEGKVKKMRRSVLWHYPPLMLLRLEAALAMGWQDEFNGAATWGRWVEMVEVLHCFGGMLEFSVGHPLILGVGETDEFDEVP